MASEEMIAEILKIMAERGVPALIIDENGHLRKISKEFLTKLFSGVSDNVVGVEKILEQINSITPNQVINYGEVTIELIDGAKITSDEENIVGTQNLYLEKFGAEVYFPEASEKLENVKRPQIVFYLKKPTRVKQIMVLTSGIDKTKLYFETMFLYPTGEIGGTSEPVSNLDNGIIYNNIANRDYLLVGIRLRWADTSNDATGRLGIVFIQEDLRTETLIEKIMPVASLYNADKTVGTEAVQIDTDTLVRDDVTILADINNTDTVYIGNAEVQKFPLEPGAALTLRKVRLADIYAVSNTDNQIIHVISGGGYNVGGGYYA